MKSDTTDHTYIGALCMKYRKSITNMATWRNFYVITVKLKEETALQRVLHKIKLIKHNNNHGNSNSRR